MQSTSIPESAIASSSSSGVVVQSPDHIVCEWKSTRTHPSGRGARRCGWRSTAGITEQVTGQGTPMTKIGFALSSEEFAAPELVGFARAATDAGFRDFMISDHFHPWTDRQGNSPFVWSVVGAIAATTGARIGTGVTCPTFRIHPAVIAQAAATSATLTDFYLGVGTGEALNEHILGDKWPTASTRIAMLEEAVELMRLLWRGELTSFDGEHFVVENARIYNVPERPIPVMVSAFGPKAAEMAGRVGDGLVHTSPDSEIVSTFKRSG